MPGLAMASHNDFVVECGRPPTITTPAGFSLYRSLLGLSSFVAPVFVEQTPRAVGKTVQGGWIDLCAVLTRPVRGQAERRFCREGFSSSSRLTCAHSIQAKGLIGETRGFGIVFNQ